MTTKIYKCEICNKIYSNYNTLWNHNKKFHKPVEVIVEKLIQCEYCAKVFKNRSTKSMHKKKCDKNCPINIEKIKLEQLKEENNKIKEETIKIKEQKKLIKLEMDKITESNKIIKLKNKITNLNQIIENNKTEKINKNITGYIYIIQLREFISLNQNIYKIGRHQSDENPIKRLKQYPKDSKCYYFRYTNNQLDSEKEILKIFQDNFTQRTDIGNEYFEGNIDLIIKSVNNYFDVNT